MQEDYAGDTTEGLLDIAAHVAPAVVANAAAESLVAANVKIEWPVLVQISVQEVVAVVQQVRNRVVVVENTAEHVLGLAAWVSAFVA